MRERLADLPRRQVILGAVIAVLVVVMAFRFLGSGSGSTSSAPVLGTPVAAPIHVASPTPAGARVVTDAQTPAAVTDALRNQEIVVVGFVIPRTGRRRRGVGGHRRPRVAPAGDRRGAVPGLQRHQGGTYGDLATILGVASTPSVVIIGSDGRIANTWTGYVDQGVIAAPPAALRARPSRHR